jgi:2-methylcitrate dehydratase PrpD
MFNYHSEEIHAEIHNGKGSVRQNVVNVRNGKGTKEVVIRTPKGRVVTRKRKVLSSKELKCIRGRKFMPGLFRDCLSGTRKKSTE